MRTLLQQNFKLTNFTVSVPFEKECDFSYSRQMCVHECLQTTRSGSLIRNGVFAFIEGDYYKSRHLDSFTPLGDYMCFNARAPTFGTYYLSLHSQVLGCRNSDVSNAITVLDEKFACQSDGSFSAGYSKIRYPSWPAYNSVLSQPAGTQPVNRRTALMSASKRCDCGFVVERRVGIAKYFNSRSLMTKDITSSTCSTASSVCRKHCYDQSYGIRIQGVYHQLSEQILDPYTHEEVVETHSLGGIACLWMGRPLTSSDGADLSMYSRVSDCPAGHVSSATGSNPMMVFRVAKYLCCDSGLNYSLCY